MKIVSSGSTLSSPEFHQKKVRARRKRIFIYSSIVLLLLGLLIFLSRLNALRIKEVAVEGAKVISAEAVAGAAKEVMSGYYLWLVPKNNALIYADDEVKNELHKRFPRFSSVELSLSGFQALNITVVEREPFALYCGEEALVEESSVCYFLDKNGFIFDFAPSFSEGVYFVYASSPVFEDPLGQAFLAREEFIALTKFIEDVSDLGFDPQALEMTGEEFRLTLANGGRLLWQRGADPIILLSNLESFLNEETIRSQGDFLLKVKELDLRTENKVFYSFR